MITKQKTLELLQEKLAAGLELPEILFSTTQDLLSQDGIPEDVKTDPYQVNTVLSTVCFHSYEVNKEWGPVGYKLSDSVLRRLLPGDRTEAFIKSQS